MIVILWKTSHLFIFMIYLYIYYNIYKINLYISKPPIDPCSIAISLTIRVPKKFSVAPSLSAVTGLQIQLMRGSLRMTVWKGSTMTTSRLFACSVKFIYIYYYICTPYCINVYDIYIQREREHTWISNIASLVCFSLFCLCFHFMPRCLASYHLWTASCATLVYILSKGMILQVPRRSLLSITPRRNLMETKLCLVMGKGTVLTSDLNDFGFGSTSLHNLCSTFMLPITAWSLPSGPVGVQHTQAATLASHALLCDAAQVPHGLWRSVEAALTTRQGRLHPSDKEWFPKMRPTAG